MSANLFVAGDRVEFCPEAESDLPEYLKGTPGTVEKFFPDLQYPYHVRPDADRGILIGCRPNEIKKVTP